jgi:hypothetical protein
MMKKIIISTLLIILLSAVAVGAYDAYQGNSTLKLSAANLSPDNSGSWSQDPGSGWGRDRGQGPGMVGQGQGQNGRGRWGQGNQQGPAHDSGMPQAMIGREWITLSGTVISVDRGMTVDTAEMGQITLQVGPPWFASQQAVTFTPGDAVTILGFAGEGRMFQAGEITNDTTGVTLHLRDPNGRPLWAGRGGRGQGGY